MKKAIYTLPLLAALSGCENFEEPAALDNFEVIVSNIDNIDPATGAYIVNVNENIEFEFLGDIVDNIMFYSGNIGEEFKYRNRSLAEEDADITPSIDIRSAVLDNNNYGTTCKFEFKTLFDDKIPAEFTDESIAAIKDWNTYTLRSTLTGVGRTTEYFNFKDGFVGENDINDAKASFDYSDWRSHKEVLYAIMAKSNLAAKNRLQIWEFNVSNNETRDYSYSYNGADIIVKKEKEHIIFKDCSIFDQNLRISTTETAANWAMYTPKTTTLVGSEEEVPNTRHYAWELPEFGLKYGELTGGYPWVKTNKFGHNIRAVYNVQVKAPNNFIDENGNVMVDTDGTPLTQPTEEMMNEPCETWMISGVHNVHKVAHDVITAQVKYKVQSNIKNFTYSYAKAGKGLYTATFHVNNQTHEATNEKVFQFKFMVVE